MGEFLVLFACMKNAGCSETSSQYYLTHPEFKEFVQTNENRLKKAAGPIVTEYVAPILWAGLGKEATTRISHSVYITFSTTHQVLMFKRDF